jgi:hypothetical protein
VAISIKVKIFDKQLDELRYLQCSSLVTYVHHQPPVIKKVAAFMTPAKNIFNWKYNFSVFPGIVTYGCLDEQNNSFPASVLAAFRTTILSQI